MHNFPIVTLDINVWHPRILAILLHILGFIIVDLTVHVVEFIADKSSHTTCIQKTILTIFG